MNEIIAYNKKWLNIGFGNTFDDIICADEPNDKELDGLKSSFDILEMMSGGGRIILKIMSLKKSFITRLSVSLMMICAVALS